MKQLSDNLNFTPTERAVVLTLVGAFLLGLGVRLFRNDHPAIPQFDYSAADAEFSAKSAAPPAAAAGPAPPPPSAAVSRPDRSNPAPLKVDLNRATKRDLMSLPGVGEVLAGRILLYREEHGAFASVNDLLKVRGIGKKKLEHIAPFCFVER